MLRILRPIGGARIAQHKVGWQVPITLPAVPREVHIPVQMHIGPASVPVVHVGQRVHEGELIARAASDPLGTPVYASISGEVFAIEERPLVNGKQVLHISIRFGGTVVNWRSKCQHPGLLSAEQLIQKIKNAGIVGLGGACFPTHAKIQAALGAEVHTLLVNAMECEPYLTSDGGALHQRSKEVVEAIRVLMQALGLRRADVAVQEAYAKTVPALRSAFSEQPNIRVLKLRHAYPSGSDRLLMYKLYGIRVSLSERAHAFGVLVLNVSTVVAIYEALFYGKPLIERVVSMTGDERHFVWQLRVRFGTTFTSLLEDYFVDRYRYRLLHAGSMMGQALDHTDAVVTAGTNAVLAISKTKNHMYEAQACIRCDRCVEVCPVGLYPSVLMDYIQNDSHEELRAMGVQDCINCGACTYICPSSILLSQSFHAYNRAHPIQVAHA